MSMTNAELVKYASNAFLAMKVSFVNMIANLCETVPLADVTVVTHAIGLDRRIGPSFLHAGLGYGGSCFPKDLKALVAFGKKQNVDLPLALATAEINEKQPLRAVDLGEKLIGDLSGKRVAVLGLAFKPDTDDMREAVSIPVIRELLKRQAHVVAYDPKAIQQAVKIFGTSISYAESAANCIRGSELSILVTEWKKLGELKPQDFKRLMKQPALVDGRRLFDPSQLAGLKFAAVGLG
jgi:UDPglucose 6-dehydrogenase